MKSSPLVEFLPSIQIRGTIFEKKKRRVSDLIQFMHSVVDGEFFLILKFQKKILAFSLFGKKFVLFHFENVKKTCFYQRHKIQIVQRKERKK